MVEFAVLGLQNPAGAQRPDAFLCDGIHIQTNTVNPILITHPQPRQPYLQGTRPFGRSYYNVHSSASEASVNSPRVCVRVPMCGV
jgi:hypothetical protein